jgi:hypothetical protein
MRQRNEKRSKRQRMSKKRRRTTKKQRGGMEWKIIVLSEDKSYEIINVVTDSSTFADNGITGNETTKYYATLSSDVEIDYNSVPQFSKTNPVIIYKKNV